MTRSGAELCGVRNYVDVQDTANASRQTVREEVPRMARSVMPRAENRTASQYYVIVVPQQPGGEDDKPGRITQAPGVDFKLIPCFMTYIYPVP